MSKIVALSKAMTVGNVSAETDDEFLFKCFFDHPAKSIVQDTNDSKSFLLGRTGAGKTAIIRKLSQEVDFSNILELNELSMGYISNSNVLRFIEEVGVPLDYFFQSLWRHIIIVEYIRIMFDVTSAEKSRTTFQRLLNWFGNNQAKIKALKYLERWSDTFWVSFDENVREIEKTLEQNVSASFGTDLEKFKTDAGYSQKLSEARRSHLQARLKEIVNSDLITELAKLQDTLAEFARSNPQKHIYIFIDGLDENWVDPKVKYKIIKALVESVKSLRRIRNLKVVSAMRSDLFEKVKEETRHDGFQSEKYADYFVDVKWTPQELKTLINKRIGFMFRSRYNSEGVFIEDIYPRHIRKKPAFEYIHERTLLRPRDVISFLNYSFAETSGKTPLSSDSIKKAERNYSLERRSALIEEWSSIYPGLEVSLSVLENRRESFPLGDLMTSELVDGLSVKFFTDDRYKSDPVCMKIISIYERCSPQAKIAYGL